MALLGLAGCRTGEGRLASTKIPPEQVHDNEQREPPGPKYPPRPGLEALGDAGLACFNRALGHDQRFSSGGVMVVRWAADAAGDLLSLDFVRDSFGDWEIDPQGQTMASCISKGLESSKVRWSRSGTAPLRFAAPPATQPASRPAG